LLSIIIPAHNEQFRLGPTLDQLAAFIAQRGERTEVLIVENGSSDRTTTVAEDYLSRYSWMRLLHSVKGKGNAVRAGVMGALGERILICDADLSVSLRETTRLLDPLASGYDIVIGSREGPGARRIGEPAYRHIMGRMFNWIVRALVVPGFQDTQCGFKALTRVAAHDIFAVQVIGGWAFDVEVLFIARQRGYRVLAVPIQWTFDTDSRLAPVRDAWQMLTDMMRIRLNGWAGRYEPRQPSIGRGT
jgi:dolichyl-phosphate beta-glucosyltransferase